MSRTSDIATVSAIFNGFGYDAVVRDSNLTPPKLRAVLEGLSLEKKTNFDFQLFYNKFSLAGIKYVPFEE